MAERIKDKDDLALEGLFRADPLPDDGFSATVMSRVRYRIWIRRLALPTALLLGLAISLKPMVQFFNALPDIVTAIFGDALRLEQLPVATVPQLSTMLFGASALMAILLASRLLEE
jgi:hypothetical protein